MLPIQLPILLGRVLGPYANDSELIAHTSHGYVLDCGNFYGKMSESMEGFRMTITGVSSASAAVSVQPTPPMDLSMVNHMRVAWLPSWSTGDAEDATFVALSGRDATLQTTAHEPEGKLLQVEATDTRLLSRLHHWSNDRVPASTFDGLESVMAALEGVVRLGELVDPSQPLVKGQWRISLAADNPWAPTVYDIGVDQAREFGLDAIIGLLRKPHGI